MSINYIKSIKSTHGKPLALAFSSLTQRAEGQSLLYRQTGIWGFFVIKNWPVWIYRNCFFTNRSALLNSFDNCCIEGMTLVKINIPSTPYRWKWRDLVIDSEFSICVWLSEHKMPGFPFRMIKLFGFIFFNKHIPF